MKKRIAQLGAVILIASLLQGCVMPDESKKKTKSDKTTTEEKRKGEKSEEAEETETSEIQTTVDPKNMCNLFVSVDYESNIVMAKYDINVYLDGEQITTIENGDEYFEVFSVEIGTHQLLFEDDDDSDIVSDYTFDVDHACTVSCSLKSHLDEIEIKNKDASGAAVCPTDEHQWEAATCTNPKTCKICGATDGEPIAHTLGTWQTVKEASCMEEGEEKAICEVCGKEETRRVEKIPHTVEEWKNEKDATCSEEGEEKGICTVCGQEVTRTIEKLPHEPGEWEVENEAKYNEQGTRIQKCNKCGEVVNREAFELSDEEKTKWLKKNCQSGMYKTISRDPDMYKGEYVKFSGKVVQVCYEAESPNEYSQYRVATRDGYDDVIFVLVANYGKSRILEDDKITIYGTSEGLYSYETVLGSKMTIPLIFAIIYE